MPEHEKSSPGARLIKAALPAVLGVVVAVASFGVLTGGAGAQVPASDDCSALVIPQDAEINTYLDKEAGLLELSWWDEALGADRIVTIGFNNPACQANPSVKSEIDHVLADAWAAQVADCAFVNSLVSRHVPSITVGRAVVPFSLAAGQTYLDKYCSG